MDGQICVTDEAIIGVTEENEVQVVNDNAREFVGTGKLILEKYRKVYCSPCAAHCLDLLLIDLAKLPWFNKVNCRVKIFANFIINHHHT